MKIDITKLTLEEIDDLRDQLAARGLIRRQRVTVNGISEAGYKVGRPRQLDYEALDWSKSDTAIARDNKVSVGSIRRMRSVLGKPRAQRDYLVQPKIGMPEFSNNGKLHPDRIDWSMTDAELARKHSVTREYVRQFRAKCGQPRVYHSECQYNRFVAAFSGVKELTHQEARLKFPKMSRSHFLKCCARSNIVVAKKTKSSLHPWDRMNWELPNVILGRIWGIKSGQVASRRHRHGIPEPKFRSWIGKIPADYIAPVEQEQQKAKDYVSINSGKLP